MSNAQAIITTTQYHTNIEDTSCIINMVQTETFSSFIIICKCAQDQGNI